ncbi:hypothetical protein CLHUN_01410 [Ruminiclostridium hungatei]|uniref:Uncharacterized protein n=1 Tax=Ruminiclostridium hungatei TaxID=48256 RepID=A0A1V4SSA0_RUMHU|nr:hypothetical protein [Ruminiclostridium hungatei]OPX46325.1 hypothetical protein CLHUN_01410 [Ruminiclostridium hungatei]
MKSKTRNLVMIGISTFAIVALAIVDISENGKLTTGFIGVVALVAGAIIIPAAFEVIKSKKL